MSKEGKVPIVLHTDSDLFREAVNYTAAETAFSARVVEKDYFCSVVLDHLASSVDVLVFRGGTSLAKVHAGFYRLSEDLDFVISMPTHAAPSQRRAHAIRVREALAVLLKEQPVFRVVGPWTGANNSRQYVTILEYTSVVSGQPEIIKVELSLREPLLMPVLDASAATILLDPVSRLPRLDGVAARCLAMAETYAEKFRAALTRREIAIRDFYDVDHASRELGILPHDAGLIQLVRQKLAVPGTRPIDISDTRLAALHQQLESQLKPVLRDKDFAAFELEHALEVVKRMADGTRE